MKIKHIVELSALDLALFLKERLKIQAHHSDLDLEVVGEDAGFSTPTKSLRTLKITWIEDDSPGPYSR